MRPRRAFMEWLRRAATPYNIDSFEQRDRYGCHICIPIDSLIRAVRWSMEYFPEEVLIGFDPTTTRNPDIVEETFGPPSSVFSGTGYILGEPHLLNVGDEFSVEHISEDWLGSSSFAVDRGNRGSRFDSFLHSHPNAFAGPSQSDASAAEHTPGVEFILGIQVENPPLGLEWYEQEGTHRRRLGAKTEGEILARLAGRKILGLELIGFQRGGLGVNILITDEEGFPLGLDL